MKRALDYLSRLCLRWGGELRLMSASDYGAIDFSDPPLSEHPEGAHGINWETRTVFATRDHANPGTIIHEMGHVFLMEGDPTGCDELDWLGWEIAVARRARCFGIWTAQNADYGISFGHLSTWGDLTLSEMREYARERIAHAQRIGVIDRRGNPRCTRTLS